MLIKQTKATTENQSWTTWLLMGPMKGLFLSVCCFHLLNLQPKLCVEWVNLRLTDPLGMLQVKKALFMMFNGPIRVKNLQLFMVVSFTNTPKPNLKASEIVIKNEKKALEKREKKKSKKSLWKCYTLVVKNHISWRQEYLEEMLQSLKLDATFF